MRRLEESVMSSDEWLEWVVEKEFCLEMEDAGWLTLKGDKVKRGFPDQFIFGPNETVVIIEFKRSGARKKRRGEKLQDHYRKQFRNLGFRTLKVTGKEEADELRRELIGKV